MGPLNEFQRRFLEMTRQHQYLVRANVGGPPPEYFGYGLQFGSQAAPLTAGVTLQQSIALQSDSWFLTQYLSVGVILPDGSSFGDLSQVTDGGNLLIQITDTGAGEDLFTIGAGFPGSPAILAAGSPLATAAGVPYVFPTPRLLPPNTNILVTVTHLGNAAGENPDMVGAYILFDGARILTP